jgi:predicted RNase H-like HicB family nuclease
MTKFIVRFEKDEGDWWHISIPELQGVHTCATSIEQGLERIREALAAAKGDEIANTAELVSEIHGV